MSEIFLKYLPLNAEVTWKYCDRKIDRPGWQLSNKFNYSKFDTAHRHVAG